MEEAPLKMMFLVLYGIVRDLMQKNRLVNVHEKWLNRIIWLEKKKRESVCEPIWVKQRTLWNLFLLILLCSFFDVLGVQMLEEKSQARWPKEITVRSDTFSGTEISGKLSSKAFCVCKIRRRWKRGQKRLR